MKPLLEVTKQEEKLSKKEEELKTVRDKLDSQIKNAEEIEKRFKEAIEAKNVLAEQLQAEIELCAEAEEMRIRCADLIYISFNLVPPDPSRLSFPIL